MLKQFAKLDIISGKRKRDRRKKKIPAGKVEQ